MAHALFLLNVLKSMYYIVLNQGLINYILALACFFFFLGLQAKNSFYTFKGLEGKKDGRRKEGRKKGGTEGRRKGGRVGNT